MERAQLCNVQGVLNLCRVIVKPHSYQGFMVSQVMGPPAGWRPETPWKTPGNSQEQNIGLFYECADLHAVEHLWKKLKHAVWRRHPSNLRQLEEFAHAESYRNCLIAVIASNGCATVCSPPEGSMWSSVCWSVCLLAVQCPQFQILCDCKYPTQLEVI